MYRVNIARRVEGHSIAGRACALIMRFERNVFFFSRIFMRLRVGIRVLSAELSTFEIQLTVGRLCMKQ